MVDPAVQTQPDSQAAGAAAGDTPAPSAAPPNEVSNPDAPPSEPAPPEASAIPEPQRHAIKIPKRVTLHFPHAVGIHKNHTAHIKHHDTVTDVLKTVGQKTDGSLLIRSNTENKTLGHNDLVYDHVAEGDTVTVVQNA